MLGAGGEPYKGRATQSWLARRDNFVRDLPDEDSRTSLGGCASLIMPLCMLAYTAYAVYTFVDRPYVITTDIVSPLAIGKADVEFACTYAYGGCMVTHAVEEAIDGCSASTDSLFIATGEVTRLSFCPGIIIYIAPAGNYYTHGTIFSAVSMRYTTESVPSLYCDQPDTTQRDAAGFYAYSPSPAILNMEVDATVECLCTAASMNGVVLGTNPFADATPVCAAASFADLATLNNGVFSVKVTRQGSITYTTGGGDVTEATSFRVEQAEQAATAPVIEFVPDTTRTWLNPQAIAPEVEPIDASGGLPYSNSMWSPKDHSISSEGNADDGTQQLLSPQTWMVHRSKFMWVVDGSEDVGHGHAMMLATTDYFYCAMRCTAITQLGVAPFPAVVTQGITTYAWGHSIVDGPCLLGTSDWFTCSLNATGLAAQVTEPLGIPNCANEGLDSRNDEYAVGGDTFILPKCDAFPKGELGTSGPLSFRMATQGVSSTFTEYQVMVKRHVYKAAGSDTITKQTDALQDKVLAGRTDGSGLVGKPAYFYALDGSHASATGLSQPLDRVDQLVLRLGGIHAQMTYQKGGDVLSLLGTIGGFQGTLNGVLGFLLMILLQCMCVCNRKPKLISHAPPTTGHDNPTYIVVKQANSQV
jgi:hypothetical protein